MPVSSGPWGHNTERPRLKKDRLAMSIKIEEKNQLLGFVNTLGQVLPL